MISRISKIMAPAIFAGALLLGCGESLECRKSVAQSVIDGVDQDQLQLDVAAIDDYLATHNITNAMELHGIKYVITQAGSGGGTPCLKNHVIVTYVGRLLDRTIFDQSPNPVSLRLEEFIMGWQIILTTFSEGTKATLYIPSVFAYGAEGRGTLIPPNTSLIFEIELIGIR